MKLIYCTFISYTKRNVFNRFYNIQRAMLHQDRGDSFEGHELKHVGQIKLPSILEVLLEVFLFLLHFQDFLFIYLFFYLPRTLKVGEVASEKNSSPSQRKSPLVI